MCICTSRECLECVEAWNEHWIHWKWSYRWLLAALWVLGTKPGSYARAANTFNPWAISLTSKILFNLPNRNKFLFNLYSIWNSCLEEKPHRSHSENFQQIIQVHLYVGRSHWVMQHRAISNNRLVQQQSGALLLFDSLICFLRQDHTVDVMSIVKNAF